MPETVDQPVAVRATAFIRPSRWLHRPVRLVRYDAYWGDGRVDFDVSLTMMMYRGYPADFAPIDESVHAHCPEVGTGRWVNEFGGVVEGPTQPEPNPPGNYGGRPRKYGTSRYEPNAKANYAWRLGGAAASLGLGVLLTTGPISDGTAGPVGVVCCAIGLALLAGLIPRKYRWW
jgi:hypothetical protein